MTADPPTDLRTLLRQAITDPGSVLARANTGGVPGEDDAEWSARAIEAVVLPTYRAMVLEEAARAPAEGVDWRAEPAGKHVPSVQRWMALDLWQAFGGEPAGFEEKIRADGWANTWAELIAGVRRLGADRDSWRLLADRVRARLDAGQAERNDLRQDNDRLRKRIHEAVTP